MSAKNRPGCEPCCVQQPGCLPDVTAGPCSGTDLGDGKFDGRGCAKCLPRYRCMRYEFTPSDYSDLCPTTGEAKLFYTCEDTWVSQNIASISVTVQLYRQSTDYGSCECVYRVTLAVGGESETVEGIHPDDLESLVYSISNEDGDYEVTLSRAGVVPNPLASKHCAPCICATCIPAALAIAVTANDACGVSRTQCDTAAFDCDGYEPVTLTTEDGDITVTVTLAIDGTCSLDVATDGIPYSSIDGGSVEKIYLETGPESDGDCSPITKFRCEEKPTGSGDTIVVGHRGSGSCIGVMESAQIDHSITVYADDGLATIATIRITDATCGPCRVPSSGACPGTCASLALAPTEGSMCAPPDITASFIHENCDDISSISFNMIGQVGVAESEQPMASGVIVLSTPCYHISNNGINSGITFELPCPSEDPPDPGRCGRASYSLTALLNFPPLECEGDVEESPLRYRLYLSVLATCTYYGPVPKVTDLVLSPDPATSSCDPFVLDFILPAWATFHSHAPCCDSGGVFKLRLTL